jgi:hypothetical protein
VVIDDATLIANALGIAKLASEQRACLQADGLTLLLPAA